MDFRTALQRLIEGVPGAMAASIMGHDGIAIDTVETESELDASGLIVEYSALLGQVRSSAQMFSAGAFEELAVRSEHLSCVMRAIDEEFFLALVLGSESSLGRARFALRVQAPALRQELR